MFTGIVEHIGQVKSVAPSPGGVALRIDAGPLVEGMKAGDSVAVNGACVTVERVEGPAFVAEAVPETLGRTTLSEARPGDLVNLERALRADGRIDGHFVQGHVDGVERVVGRRAGARGVTVAISLSPPLARYVAPKGSIAVDGTSLTVVDVLENSCTFVLVPYTIERSLLGRRAVGDRVNVEVDVLAKYVHRLLGTSEWPRKLDEAFLAEHGFLT